MVKQKPSKSSAAASALSPAEEALQATLDLQRTRVVCGPDMNYNTSSTIAANQFMASGVDSAFNLQTFKQGLNISVNKYTGDDMEFEVKGLSCAMANSLRRIMIAEVPTMAIEHVYIVNNTSIIQDEVLAHRLGLIPLKVDPHLFQYKSKEEAPNEQNTIVLKLKVECRRLADGTVENETVCSNALTWVPEGSEMPDETSTRFTTGQAGMLDDVRPVHDDILLAKLRPGQAIELECHCIKGVGEEHAKWSPVATTWYRLKPEVVLLRQPPAGLAQEMAQELPGLVRVVGSGSTASVDLEDASKHDVLLEKVRRMSGEPKWAPYLQLRKIKNHFIFTIESTGAWRPHDLFNYAVQLMISKCDKVLEGLGQFPTYSF